MIRRLFGKRTPKTEDKPVSRVRLKTYYIDLIREDLTLIGSGTFIYSARAKSKDGESVEVILKLKDGE